MAPQVPNTMHGLFTLFQMLSFIDHVANVFVFEETAGSCGKWNSRLAVRQGNFAPFFSFVLCAFFSLMKIACGF